MGHIDAAWSGETVKMQPDAIYNHVGPYVFVSNSLLLDDTIDV